MPAWTVCGRCAALVADPAAHVAWHESLPAAPVEPEPEEPHDGD